MKPHSYARGLLVVAITVMAVAGGTGVAHADGDPLMPSGPGILDQMVRESNPALVVDPANKGGPSHPRGGVGMRCENPRAQCRNVPH
jgi:hypothetical protein